SAGGGGVGFFLSRFSVTKLKPSSPAPTLQRGVEVEGSGPALRLAQAARDVEAQHTIEETDAGTGGKQRVAAVELGARAGPRDVAETDNAHGRQAVADFCAAAPERLTAHHGRVVAAQCRAAADEPVMLKRQRVHACACGTLQRRIKAA